MRSDIIVPLCVAAVMCTAIYYIFNAVNVYNTTPQQCTPVIVTIKDKYNKECNPGTMALPPEKVQDEDGKDVYIVRCVCEDKK